MTIRSERTKAEIRDAFITLLQTKLYADITMSDVARQANRGRSGVYYHYQNKEAILLDCFSQAIEELKEKVSYPSQYPERGGSPIVYANLLLFYTHVADNRALYQALFRSSASPIIRARFRRVVAGVLLTVTEQTDSLAIFPAPPDMVCNLIGEMAVGAAVWWLDTESSYPPTLLAEIVVRLGEAGVFGLSGQEPVETDLSYRPFVPHQPEE